MALYSVVVVAAATIALAAATVATDAWMHVHDDMGAGLFTLLPMLP
jgi:hypothetical protein